MFDKIKEFLNKGYKVSNSLAQGIDINVNNVQKHISRLQREGIPQVKQSLSEKTQQLELKLGQLQQSAKSTGNSFLDKVGDLTNYLELDKPTVYKGENPFLQSLDQATFGNLRGAMNLLDIPSRAVGGALKSTREYLTGNYQAPNNPASKYIHPLAVGAYRGVTEKQPVFEEVPKTLGMNPDSLGGLAVGLAAEIGIPDPFDVARVANKSPELISVSRKLLASDGQKILSKLSGERRLAHLTHYSNQLIESGFSKSDVKRISAQEAASIFKKGLTRDEWVSKIDDAREFAQVQLFNHKNTFKEGFANWVNERRAGKIAARQSREAFQHLDNEGMEAFFRIQKEGGSPELRQFFDTTFQKLKDAKVKIGYQKNYLPQIWQNSSEAVEKFQKTLSQSSSVTRGRIFEDYLKGIEFGLTPKYESVSDLTAFYEARTSKLLADKKYFDFLEAQDLIRESRKAPRNWVTLDPDSFPGKAIKTADGEVIQATYKAPEELAGLINNYLKEPSFEGMKKFAGYASRVKNIALSAGIPGTAVNFHGFNILVRNVLSSKNPASGLFKGIKYMFKGDIDLEAAKRATKYGLTLGVEDHSFTKADEILKTGAKGLVQKLSKGHAKAMEEPLFGRMIPALKLGLWDDLSEDLIKSGFEKEEALRMAAKQANEVFGGLNFDAMGRSKDLQNFWRSTILAPDWSGTTLRLGKNTIKSMTTKRNSAEFKVYRRVVRNLAAMYASASIANKLLNDRWLHENPVGRTFEVQIGTTSDGKARYLRPFATASDFVRLPYDIIAGIAKGDFRNTTRVIANRLSMPVGAAVHLLSNVDYRGRPITGRDRYGKQLTPRQQVLNVGNELLSTVGIPPQLRTGVDIASGKIKGEEAAVQLTELPVRYQTQLYKESDKDMFDSLVKSGVEPQKAVDRIKATKKKADSNAEKFNLWTFLFGDKGEIKADGATNDPVLRAIQDEKRLDEQTKKIKEIFELATSQEEAETLLQESGIDKSYQEASVSIIKNLGVENGNRPQVLQEMWKSSNNWQAFRDWAISEGLLTDSVVKYWVASGEITEEAGSNLKAYIKATKNPKTSKKKSGLKKRGTSAKFKRFNIKTPRSKRLTLPKTPRGKIPSLGSLDNFKIKEVSVR